jgi:hypothetical protein
MPPVSTRRIHIAIGSAVVVLAGSLAFVPISAAYPERVADSSTTTATTSTTTGSGPTRPNQQGLHTGHANPTPAPVTPPPATAAPSAAPTPTPTPAPTPTPRPSATPAPTAPAPTPSPTPTPALSNVVYVTTNGVDSGTGSSTSPWRTISYAVAHAPAGATIQVGSGTYAPFSISRSGLTIQPIGTATVTISGGTTAVAITGSQITLRGLRITGASSQGLWLDSASDVRLEDLDVRGNLGHGAQIIRSTRVTVVDSTFAANLKSGLRELTGTADDRYLRNTIVDNGHDGYAYNGDGLLLQGSGAVVRNNVISRNGDSPNYEHGIYAADGSTNYVIEDNVLKDNAASGIKAGGTGLIDGNVISGSVRGLVFTGGGGTLTVQGNSVDATTWAIVVTADCVIARYRSDFNSFVRTSFGYLGTVDLPRWRTLTGLDLHSS